MSEEKKDELTGAEEKEPFVPASKGKRIAAWVAVVLMVFLVIIYSYSIATGAFLNW